MSAARNQALIEAKNTGKLSVTSTWTPVLVKPSQGGRAGSEGLSQKRSSKASLGLASVLAGAVAIGYYQPWQTLTATSVAAETGGGDVAEGVTIARPAAAVSASVVLPATFRAWQTATLHARVSGYLAVWHRELGSQVKVGEVLAEIETPELDQELAQGEALTREAEAAAVQAQAEQARP